MIFMGETKSANNVYRTAHRSTHMFVVNVKQTGMKRRRIWRPLPFTRAIIQPKYYTKEQYDCDRHRQQSIELSIRHAHSHSQSHSFTHAHTDTHAVIQTHIRVTLACVCVRSKPSFCLCRIKSLANHRYILTLCV